MRVSAEIELAAAAVADVRVELGGGEVGVAEHLLDAAEIGASFEQVSGERVAEQVGVDPLRLEPCLLCQPAQHEEDPGTGQTSALGVEEELRPVTAVEVGAPAREVAPQRVGRGPAQGDDPLL